MLNLNTEQWQVFCARLSIPRHQATICELNGYLYVMGGHTVALPNEFINSIERCHITSVQSQFELINVNFAQRDLRLQTILSFPSHEDDGILMVGMSDDGSN